MLDVTCDLRQTADLLDGLELGFCAFDAEDRALGWNKTFLRFFPEHDGHVFVGEHYGDNLRRFYKARLGADELPLIEDHVAKGIARHRSQSRPFSFEHRGRWLRVVAQSIPGVGRVRSWTEVPAPLDNAQKDEVSLATSPSAVVDDLPDGIAAFDGRGRITSVNAEFRAIYGLSHEGAVIGRSFREVVEAVWAVAGPSGPADFITVVAPHLDEALRFPGAAFEVPLPAGRWVRVIERVDQGRLVSNVHFDITLFKREEERLRLAEARARRREAHLKSIIDRAPIGMTVVSADGSIVETNSAFRTAFGLDDEGGCIGQPLASLTASCAHSALATLIAAAQADDVAASPAELEFVRRDGRVMWGAVSAVRLDESGPISHLLVQIQDVTIQKEAEADRNATLDRLSATLQSMDQGLLMVDADEIVQLCNPKALELLDLPAEFMACRPRFQDVLAFQMAQGEFTAESLPEYRRWLSRGHFNDVETYQRTRPNGAMLEIRTVPLRTGGAVRTFTDITHLANAEAQAREANRMLLLAEQIAKVGHWRVDLRSNSLTWSSEVFRMHGLDETTFRPEVATAIEAYHADDREEVSACVSRAICSGSSFQFALRIMRPDGETRNVLSRGLAETGADGVVVAIFGTIMDVTELKRAERTIMEKSVLLEATLDSMDQGLVMIGGDGRVQVANRRFCELLDLPSEFVAKNPDFEDVLERLDQSGEFASTDDDFQIRIRNRGAPLTLGTYERRRPNGTILGVRTVAMAAGQGVVRTYADITAQREAESAVSESEARFRMLAETTNDVITKLSLGLRLEYVSPAVRNLLGYEPADMLGLDSCAVLDPEDAPPIHEMRRKLAAGEIVGDRLISTYRSRHKNGHAVWIEADATLLRDPTTGAPSAILCSSRDIGDRKRAELALIESQARYRLLAETTNDVITRLNLDFKREYVSPTIRALLGFEPEELLGHQPSATIHPDDAQIVRELARGLVAGQADGDRVTATYRTQHKDGRWIWIDAAMSLVRDEASGQPLSIVCSLRDVTLRRSAELALQDSEARYRLLAENTSELIMLGHDDGRRSYISPASMRLLGYTPDELHAMKLRDYVHQDDIGKLFEATSKVGRGQDQAAIVYRSRHKERGWIWVEGVFRRVPDAGAGEPSIVATFRDVSERQLQADALEKAKIAAEMAQEQAEAASTAKSDFLASMSHEIRTPLHSVIGYTDLLLEKSNLSAEQLLYASRIKGSGTALLTVVNDILDFSKIEAGEIELELQPFDLASMVDETIAIVQSMADAKGLALAATIGRDVPAALIGDRDRLRQILLNLLNNAIKFTATGSVTLAVSHIDTCALRPLTSFSICDTGIGIAMDRIDRLFKRFSQVDGSVRREFGGTGLGLAISKQLVELMSGTIGVDSVPGMGSTFWFAVPLEGAAIKPKIAAVDAISAEACQGIDILLVEDIEINQQLAVAILKMAGHRVDVVGDGADAIMAVQAKVYDVVLMDVQMPGMDGVTATHHIRELEGASAHVPIIAMTANVLPAQIQRFRDAGMDAHVGKPFKRDELFATIDRALKPVGKTALDDSYDLTREVLGPEGMVKMLRLLQSMLAEDFVDHVLTGPVNPSVLAAEAHKVVSAAGMLGFRELSEKCATLEEACRTDRQTLEMIEEARRLRDMALATIAEICAA